MVVNNGSYYLIYDGTKEISKYSSADAYDVTEDIKLECGHYVKVKFETNGANEIVNDLNVVYQLFYGNLPTVTKDNYTFDGWYSESSFTNKITSETRVTNYDEHTLYAKWVPKTYTANLDSNGGNELSKKSINVVYLTKPVIDIKPTKTNYYFDGWYTQAEGGVELFNKNNIVNANVEGFTNSEGNWINSDTPTLYAHWQKSDLANASIDAIPDQVYTSSEIKPNVNVQMNGYTLIKDTDFTVSYSNNINVGTATVTMSGKGDFTGTKTVTFKIIKAQGLVTLSSSANDVKNNTNVSSISTFKVTGNKSGGALSVSSSNKTISASISGTTVTWIASGNATDQATITVTSAATDNYESASATFTATAKRDKFFDEDVGDTSGLAYHQTSNASSSAVYGGKRNSRSYNSLNQQFTTGVNGDYIGAKLKYLEAGHVYVISGTMNQKCSGGVIGTSAGYNDFYLTYRINKWTQNDITNGHYGWAYNDPWSGYATNTWRVWCSNPSGNVNNSFACNHYSISASTYTYSFSLQFTAKNTDENYIYWDPWGCNDHTTFIANMYNLKLIDKTRGGIVVRGGNN